MYLSRRNCIHKMNKISNSTSAFGLICSVTILLCFIAPQLLIPSLKHFHFAIIAVKRDHATLISIAVCGYAIASWIAFFRKAQKSESQFLLWLVIGAWLGLHIVVMVTSLRYDNVSAYSTMKLLVAYSSRLLLVSVVGSFNRYAVLLVLCGAVQGLWFIYSAIGARSLILNDALFKYYSGEFAVLSIFIVPLAFSKVVKSERSNQKFLWIICSAILLSALSLAGQPIMLVITIISLLLLLTKNSDPNQFRILGIAVISFGVLSIYIQLKTSPSSFSVNTFRPILDQFDFRFALFRSHWFTGLGLGAYESTPGSFYLSQPFFLPDNTLFFWLDEMGVAGGLFFLLFVMLVVCILRGTTKLTMSTMPVWFNVFCAAMLCLPFDANPSSCGNMLVFSLLALTIMMPQVNREKSNIHSTKAGMAQRDSVG